VRGEEEDGVGDCGGRRVVAAEEEGLEIVDGDEHEVGVGDVAAAAALFAFPGGAKLVFVVCAQSKVYDGLAAAVVESSSLVTLDDGFSDLLVQQSAIPPLRQPAFRSGVAWRPFWMC